MKKILAFTLKPESDYSEERFNDDLRLIAYMLYDDIYSYMDVNEVLLNLNKSIEFNNINENKDGRNYVLNSDLYDDDLTYYEPFLVGKNTFCLTVIDGSVTVDFILNLLYSILKMLHLNFTVEVSEFNYEAKNIDDEKNRDKAISKIYDKLGLEYVKKSSLIRRLMFKCGINNHDVRKR